jgi:hypothetical protein
MLLLLLLSLLLLLPLLLLPLLLLLLLLLLLPTTELGDGQGYGMVGGVAFTRTKEKNRLAQQRFRAKQKNMVAALKSRLAELEDLVSRKSII